MSLQAAFRKRLIKAASRPGRQPIPGPSRKISGHKDKRGSTAHHRAGAEEHPKAYEQGRRGGRGDKLLGHRSEYARHGEELDRPGSYTHEYSQGYKEGQGATGKHKNMQAAVMKAVRMVSKHKDKRGSTKHHQRRGRREEGVKQRIKVGDWIKTDYGFRGQVVGEGTLGNRKNPVPAYKIDVGDGKITAVLKEDAQFMSESA